MSVPVYFEERDNNNSLTSSPFTMWVDCLSGESYVTLPQSLFLEAHIASDKPLWLSSIRTGVVYFSAEDSTGAEQEVAFATVLPGLPSPVYNVLTLGVIGAIVCGTEVGAYSTSGTYTFTSRTVYLASRNTLPLFADKVTSITDSDGRVATGQINLTAGSGAQLSLSGNTITVTFPYPEPASSPFRYLVLEIYNGTLFTVAYDGASTINLFYDGASLDAVCTSKKEGVLPDSDGNLPAYPYNGYSVQAPAEPVPVVSGIKHTIIIPVVNTGGAITITSVPTQDLRTRLSISKAGDSEVKVELLG